LRSEYGIDYRNESGMRFLQFTYKDEIYPEKWGVEIIHGCRQRIGQLVTYVGLNINRFLAGI